MQYTKAKLEEAVQNTDSLTDCLIFLGQKVSGSHVRYIKYKIFKYNIDTSHFKIKLIPPKYNYNLLLNNKRLKGLLLEHNIPYICAICNQQPYWNNLDLTLQIDHIDGNRENNDLTNLRFICPNCHTQTQNYTSKNIQNKSTKHICQCGGIKNRQAIVCLQCRKNKFVKKESKTIITKHINNTFNQCDCGNTKLTKSKLCRTCNNRLVKVRTRKVERPTKEELLELIKTQSFTQIGKLYNVSDNAVRKWCKCYEIPFRKKDLKD